MAKKTFQNINFVTGVVDGTLAYDFDAPGYYPEEERVYAPPKRRRAPGARPNQWVREETGERTDARTGADRLGVIVNAASAVGAVAAVILLVMVLLAKIQLVGISSAALGYENEISELQSEHSRLTVQYEQVFNLKDVKEVAMGELGMQEPREDQIYYLSGVSSADKAVVITREDTGMFSLGLEDIISSARSYIQNIIG